MSWKKICAALSCCSPKPKASTRAAVYNTVAVQAQVPAHQPHATVVDYTEVTAAVAAEAQQTSAAPAISEPQDAPAVTTPTPETPRRHVRTPTPIPETARHHLGKTMMDELRDVSMAKIAEENSVSKALDLDCPAPRVPRILS